MNIQSHKVAINPSILPRCEQFILHRSSIERNGKVLLMRFESLRSIQDKPKKAVIIQMEPTLKNIAEAVVRHFNITLDDLKSPSREGDVMKARLIFYGIAKEKSNLSLGKIAAFVNRAHCTVISGWNSLQLIERKSGGYFNTRQHYELIKEMFK